MAHHHFTLFHDCCFSEKLVPRLKLGVSVCVCVCVQIRLSSWRGGRRAVCVIGLTPLHTVSSHTAGRLVHTQNIYCPTTSLQGNLSFFSPFLGMGGGWVFFFSSPICLPLIPGKGMRGAERETGYKPMVVGSVFSNPPL